MTLERTPRKLPDGRVLARFDSIVAYSLALVTAIAFAIGLMSLE